MTFGCKLWNLFLFLFAGLVMTTLTIQLLVSTIVIVSFSFSQKYKDGRGRSDYVGTEKQFNIKEIIRFGGERGKRKRETTENKVSADKDLSPLLTTLSPLLVEAHSAASLKKLLPLSGLQGLDKGENNTGTAIVCGR